MSRIKELRKEKGLTQEQLAKMIGINPVTLSRYETGDRNPKLDKLLIMSRIFEAQVDYILGNTDERTYEFRSPTDTKTTSFAVFVESDEYKDLYFECKKQQIDYLKKEHSYLNDASIENIAQNLARKDIEIFWEKYLKS